MDLIECLNLSDVFLSVCMCVFVCSHVQSILRGALGLQ